MVLVLRSEDKKVVSVSRKKLKFYEGIYCLPPHINPVTSKMVSVESADQGEYDAEFVPKTVQSVKQSHLLDFSKQVSKKAQRKQAAAVANELEDTHLTAIDQGEGTLEGPSKFQEENIEIETLRDQPLIDAVAEEAAATRIEPALRERLIDATKAYVAETRAKEIGPGSLRAGCRCSTLVAVRASRYECGRR